MKLVGYTNVCKILFRRGAIVDKDASDKKVSGDQPDKSLISLKLLVFCCNVELICIDICSAVAYYYCVNPYCCFFLYNF